MNEKTQYLENLLKKSGWVIITETDEEGQTICRAE